jgi:hypothetical protein
MKVKVLLSMKVLLEGRPPFDDEFRVFPLICRDLQFIEVEVPDYFIELLKYIDGGYLNIEIEGGKIIDKEAVKQR